MSTMTIKTTVTETSLAPTDSGAVVIENTANNVERINAQLVNHNASVVATTAPGTTPGDVTIVGGTIQHLKVLAMTFICTLKASNSNPTANGAQVYLKLVGALGSAHDFVIPLIPGQIFIWTPTPTTDVNGATFTLETAAAVLNAQALAADFTVVCTPDKYSDVTISGSIELTN